MLRINKRLTSIITAVVVSTGLIFSSGSFMTKETSAAINPELNNTVNQYGLANTTKDGTILHAFSWRFSTIKSKMKEIANAGYSSIQVSPIENCLQNSNGQHTWEWENTYQPTNYQIGNYVVGSRDEFKDMCAEAEKYGIKIIVDVVANHTASRSLLDSSLRDSSLFHNTNRSIADQGVWEWDNRWCVTQKDLMGMPDLNTQSYKLQEIIENYLNDCIDCGADGFRFDTAKHIELPKNIDTDFGGDFWPNIVNSIKAKKSDAFIYGEVLQNSNADAFKGYSQYIGLTADWYGGDVRKAIKDHNLLENISDYKSEGVSPDQLVTYSETHDTYANAGQDSADMNNWQVSKGYAIVAARAKGTPLFLARPKSTGRTCDGKLEGPLGQPQNDWNDPEIIAVNKFHNAMIGQDEYIRKVNNNTVAVERGNKGMVVVNLDGGFNGILQTRMAPGKYIDAVSGDEVDVSNGVIHLNVKSGKTAVIYREGVPVPPIPTEDNIAYLKLPAGWSEPYAYVYNESNGRVTQNAAWPGVKMTKVSDGLYSYKVDKNISNPLVIFNDRNQQYPMSGEAGLSINGSMILDGTSWTPYDTPENPDKPITKKTAYIQVPFGWSEPYAYVYQEGNGTVKQNAAWPGVKMTKVSNGLYKYEVDGDLTNPLVIFNDRSHQYPESGQPGLSLDSAAMIYSNGVWSEYTK